jgi:hypothetical protein
VKAVVPHRRPRYYTPHEPTEVRCALRGTLWHSSGSLAIFATIHCGLNRDLWHADCFVTRMTNENCFLVLFQIACPLMFFCGVAVFAQTRNGLASNKKARCLFRLRSDVTIR